MANNKNEAAIRRIIEDWAEALRAKQLDRMLAHYARDIVLYDAVAPLQYRGIEAYRKNWEDWFKMVEGPIAFEFRDLTVVANDEIAFARSLSHMSALQKSGERGEMWVRWTSGWRHVERKWRIIHEHISVPFDPTSGQAVMDLKP